MPYKLNDREPTYTARKKILGDEPWYVTCTIHGEFENNVGRCLLCDEVSANYSGDAA